MKAAAYDDAIANLQSQIDGQIDSYFYAYDPTTSNVPASGWSTTALKDAHIGDTFTNIWDGTSGGGSGTSGASWRWVASGGVYSWQVIADTATQKALALAAEAKDTADHKRRVFTETPTTPYDVGDLFVDGETVKSCTTAKTASGTYSASDWTLRADVALPEANAAQSTADGAAGHANDIDTSLGLVDGFDWVNKRIAFLHGDGINWTPGNLRNLDNQIDGANFRRVGIGYTDPNGRVNRIWRGSAYVDGVDIAAAGDSITRFGDRTLDHIDSSASYSKQPTGSFHGETVDNANFTSPITADGVVPGWGSFLDGTVGYTPSAHYNGANVLWVTGSAANFGAESIRKYACQPGDVIHLSADLYAGAGGPVHLRVRFYQADGTAISDTGAQDGITTDTGTWQTWPTLKSAPANAAYFTLLGFSITGGSFGMMNMRLSVNDVRVAGSGIRLGDLRNQVAVGYANFGAGWSGGNISYTASSDGTATINVSSATLQAGSIALTYSASSVSVSGGAAGGSSVYYLYYDDPDSSGGAKTLHATTSQITSLASDGRRLVGQITVTFPSSGSGSGGGGLGCITPDAYVMIHRASETRIITAGELQKTYRTGDYIRAVEPSTGLEWWQQIDSVQLGVANGVTVTTANGCQLTCTDIAWLGQPDGSRIRAKDTQGQSLYTRAGASAATVTSAGTIDIVKIMSGGVFFLASSDGQNWLAHHNLKTPP